MSFASWIENRRWAANVRRARQFRADCLFSERQVFDAALRRPVDGEQGRVFAYPDTFYLVRIDAARDGRCVQLSNGPARWLRRSLLQERGR